MLQLGFTSHARVQRGEDESRTLKRSIGNGNTFLGLAVICHRVTGLFTRILK